jgi:orotidine-5'-phosphate decarboxylase
MVLKGINIKLIVALDFDHQKEAEALVSQLDPTKCALKIGSEMFTGFGTQWVKQCIAQQFKVFLDLKFHDIPNTVARACSIAADLGVWMLNVHASGGLEMMQAARAALEPYSPEKRPILIAVTVLTSMSDATLRTIGINIPLAEHVNELARIAKIAGLDGVVCSAHEASQIKSSFSPSFITVTPGIRLEKSEKDDQHRIMTPQQAIQAGSDYLVIGRPITKAPHPSSVVEEILQSIGYCITNQE